MSYIYPASAPTPTPVNHVLELFEVATSHYRRVSTQGLKNLFSEVVSASATSLNYFERERALTSLDNVGKLLQQQKSKLLEKKMIQIEEVRKVIHSFSVSTAVLDPARPPTYSKLPPRFFAPLPTYDEAVGQAKPPAYEKAKGAALSAFCGKDFAAQNERTEIDRHLGCNSATLDNRAAQHELQPFGSIY